MIIVAVYFALALVLFYVIYCDIRFRIIPDLASAAIIFVFLALAVIDSIALNEGLAHGLTGFVTFIATLICFRLGLMGGGDVKLLSALALLMGPKSIIPFLLLTSLFGGILGLFRLVISLVTDWRTRRRLEFRAALKGEIPYGVAIALAALVLLPTTRYFTTMTDDCARMLFC